MTSPSSAPSPAGGTLPTAAQVLTAELRRHGTDRIFCVPGESFLDVLDALVDAPEIEVVTCRHEGGACMAAEAHAKATGRPGVVFVTRGPGATNAASGIHVAQQDSTPLLMFVGQIARDTRERDAFQELDLRAVFGSFTKWTTEIEIARRIPETIARAFQAATAGRPGPVVIGLPEDMLRDRVEAVPAQPFVPAQARLSEDDAAAIGAALRAASRPILMVGGGGWSSATAERAQAFAQAWRLPVVSGFRCQDYVDNTSDCYVGNLGLGANPALADAVRRSDLLLAIGTRLDDISTLGFKLLRVPLPETRLIHVHPSAEDLGRVYQAQRLIVASPASAFERLAALEPPVDPAWRATTAELREGFVAWTRTPDVPGPLQPGRIVDCLRRRLPADAIVTNGAGNFAIWPNRYHHYRRFRTMLAPVSGSMGYAIPAALAAKLAHRDRVVVSFTGDGDFLMTGQELATAAKHGLAFMVLLFNNGMYGTIRMHQEQRYPARVSATSLHNPDFVMLARSYGAHAERIARTEDFEPAFERALGCGTVALLELVLDPEVIAPTQTITSLRAAAGGQGNRH